MAKRRSSINSLLVFIPQAALLGLAGILPYRMRLALGGWIGRTAVRHVPRLRSRADANLAYVMPELSPGGRKAIAIETGDTFGRTFIEILNNKAFHERGSWTCTVETGIPAVEEAMRSGKGVVFVTGHFGQFEAGRAWAASIGINCAGVYRPTDNPHLNRIYLRNLEYGGTPMFEKGPRAMRGIVGHLSKGGMVAILTDQYERLADRFDFAGKPAPTSTIAAALALKFGLPLVPVYCIREKDGEHVSVVVEAPIPHTDVREMTQAVNDSLAAMIQAHPGQYYWLHRRWEKKLPGMSG